MTSYPYIETLFTEILKCSKAIKGRFYIGHSYGLQDINFEALTEEMQKFQPNKYPLVMMAPPHSYLELADKRQGWDEYRIILFFCKASYLNSDGTVQNPNDAKISKHTIPQDWHDMKRCAVNFLRALKELQYSNPSKYPYQISTTTKPLFIPFQNVGGDKIAGVRVAFDLRVNVGCNIEDYDEYPDFVKIKVDLDGHREHKL